MMFVGPYLFTLETESQKVVWLIRPHGFYWSVKTDLIFTVTNRNRPKKDKSTELELLC